MTRRLWLSLTIGLLAATCVFPSIGGAQERTLNSEWNRFTKVVGQPEAVPVEWVSTKEGAFAHSLVSPQPVRTDSGYRAGMSSAQYFDHLCKSEAGEFIKSTAVDVEGLYFARPPVRPMDADLQDRYRLEAPDIERTFHLMRPTFLERAGIFIAPPFNNFKFIEEPHSSSDGAYVKAFGFRGGKTPMQGEVVPTLNSKYGLTWRGVKRPKDREHLIAGSEWIVFNLKTNEVLGVMRNYARTGGTRNTPDGIWWLNAVSCPIFAEKYRYATSERIYDFVSKVLKPPKDAGAS